MDEEQKEAITETGASHDMMPVVNLAASGRP
jgi:hypothetical protein